MPGTTGLNGPHRTGPGRTSSMDSFARFRQVATTQPEKLRNLPALAKELGIGESTAYRYRQRLARLRAEAAPARNGSPEGTLRPADPPAAAQQPHAHAGPPVSTQPPTGAPHPAADAAQLTPKEVDQEISKILVMARRIRGFRRTRKAVTDTYIAAQLGIEVADIAITLRFEQVYLELERRLHQHKHQAD
jgi:hypothetical protein